jgi:hypothetical protein
MSAFHSRAGVHVFLRRHLLLYGVFHASFTSGSEVPYSQQHKYMGQSVEVSYISELLRVWNFRATSERTIGEALQQ